MSVLLTWVSRTMTVLLLASSAPSQTLTTAPSTLHTVLSAIPFASPDGVELVADLYLPGGAGPFPAIVFIHGGGWSSGDRSQLHRQAALMADQGMVGMAIEYRLAPAHPFPAAIEDARAAVVWLRGHAADYHVDPTRIGTVGSSAGGQLAAMLGVETPRQADLGSTVRMVVVLNGIFDFSTMPQSKMIDEFLGKACTDLSNVCAAASPIAHVQAGQPPFLLMHGTADQTAPYTQATSFFAKLVAAGNTNSRLFTIPDAPHTFWSKPAWAQLSDKTMAAFLHLQLDH